MTESTENSPDTTDKPAADPVEPFILQYEAGGTIVARAGRYYRNARYIMAIGCLALSGWFAYDGWVKYPAHNAAIEAAIANNQKPDSTMHSDLDINIQRILAMALPLVAVGILLRTLHNSRGELRLEGDTLVVPGHPPVPLDDIRAIDTSKWKQKGIAWLEYETQAAGSAAPAKGSIRLDDFVYQQDPTDAIYKVIEKRLVPPEATAPNSKD